MVGGTLCKGWGGWWVWMVYMCTLSPCEFTLISVEGTNHGVWRCQVVVGGGDDVKRNGRHWR